MPGVLQEEHATKVVRLANPAMVGKGSNADPKAWQEEVGGFNLMYPSQLNWNEMRRQLLKKHF